MSDHKEPRVGRDEAPTPITRRPYEKPGFITSLAFERQALSCAGMLNTSPAFPVPNCALNS